MSLETALDSLHARVASRGASAMLRPMFAVGFGVPLVLLALRRLEPGLR